MYIDSKSDIADKIAAVDTVIAALEAQELAMAENPSPIQEYMLNDGETLIKTSYNSQKSIRDTLEILERRRNKLINRYNGRCTRSVDSKNFTGRY